MYDPFPNTLKARHLNFGTVGASSVTTSLAVLSNGTKAYYGFYTPGSSPNQTAFYNSGYQYQPLTPGETTLTETFLVFDSVTQNPITTISEYLVFSDSVNSIIPANGTPDAIDYFPSTLKPTYNNFSAPSSSCNQSSFRTIVAGQKAYLLAPRGVSCNQYAFRESGYQFLTVGDPSYTTTLNEYFLVFDSEETETPGQTTLYEYFIVSDTAEGPPILSENFVMLDSEITQNPVTELTETFLMVDGVSGTEYTPPTPVTFDATLIFKVKTAIQDDFTLINKVKVAQTSDYSIKLGTFTNDLVAVTNASSVSNPAMPTFIDRNGVTWFSNPATLPDSTVPADNCYVGLACNNLLDTIPMDDVFRWNINITGGGGTWDTLTATDLPDFGASVAIFGLSGIVTRKGFSYSNSSGGYENGGIFGNRNMSKQFAFFIYGQESYYYNMMDQFANTPSPVNYKTHADAIGLIGQLTGINVAWAIQDFPLANFQPQASQTVEGAVRSLAEDVGGVLRWSGNTGYKIVYPDQSIGRFTIPDCCLIQAVSKECNLDLNTGFYSPGVRFVPQLSLINSTTKQINQAGDGTFINNNPLTTPDDRYSGMVESFATIGQEVTSNDAIIPMDLPLDAVGVMIRVISASRTTGNYVVSQAEIELGADPWFYLEGVPGTATAGNHISVVEKQGQLKYNLNVKPDLFSDWADGDKMQFGFIRRSQPYIDNAEGSSLLFAQNYLRYQFIPICVGSVTFTFFGAMPMPGMDIDVTFNGQHITGIIESVNYSSPGVCTVNFVQWLRMEYYQQLSEMGNF